jgi:hypothetical protein
MDELTHLHLPGLSAIPGFDGTAETLQTDQSAIDVLKKRRPPNAFLLFCVENRGRVRQEYPEKPNVEVSRILADMWKELDESNRSPYRARATEQQHEFKQLVPDYKYDKAKNRRMSKKPSDYDPKNRIELADLNTLVNLPPDELRAYVSILQSHLLITCQQNFQHYLQDPESFPRVLDENFPHDVFQSGQ